MQEIKDLANFGVAGLAVFFMYRIASNHIEHNTSVLGDLRDTIKDLKEFLQHHK